MRLLERVQRHRARLGQQVLQRRLVLAHHLRQAARTRERAARRRRLEHEAQQTMTHSLTGRERTEKAHWYRCGGGSRRGRGGGEPHLCRMGSVSLPGIRVAHEPKRLPVQLLRLELLHPLLVVLRHLPTPPPSQQQALSDDLPHRPAGGPSSSPLPACPCSTRKPLCQHRAPR